MRRLHLLVGILAVLAFLITGQIMRHHEPLMSALSAETRLMLRSRHIYILAGGLVNLMLGIYVQQRHGWRGVMQDIGSAFLVLSPALLIAAFAVEPAVGFRREMWWSTIGLYTLFGGAMLHLTTITK
ncbi:MAG TPA: hypothetical protein VKB88_38950 [Bryobacteraceae bacterium]|nr:hypothetical protein [Bryobacteraceae bacterium]